jgi:thiol-disulfide isomerase/thioredoxin
MKQLFTFLFLALFYITGLAQTIEFHFPHLAGNEYLIYLNKGTQNDTVQKGTIAANGHFMFTLPEKDKDYAGMVNWATSQVKQSLVLNNESISIKATNASPNESSVVFENSKENDFWLKQIAEFKEIFQKTDAIYRVKNFFSQNSALYQAAEKELISLNQAYQAKLDELINSQLYAARYIEVFNFLNGFVSDLTIFGQEKQDDAIQFIIDRLDMDALYSSGFWSYTISSAFDLFPDKALFGQAMVKNLQRTRSQKIFDVLAHDLITICEQYAWKEAEDTIVSYLVSSGRLKNPTGSLWMIMEMNKVKAGNKAIPIQGIKNLSNSLLIFYESGCSNCQALLEDVVAHYPALKEKKVRVISIASDHDKQVFENFSAIFPWTDKLCDYKGFEGDNFLNYHIIGTPTIFVIDKKGYITGRYAKLHETGLIN